MVQDCAVYNFSLVACRQRILSWALQLACCCLHYFSHSSMPGEQSVLP